MERLPKCAASFLIAKLWPEQCEERVAPNGRIDALEGQVRKEGQPLGVCADGLRFRAIVGDEAHAAQREKLAHERGLTVSGDA